MTCKFMEERPIRIPGPRKAGQLCESIDGEAASSRTEAAELRT